MFLGIIRKIKKKKSRITVKTLNKKFVPNSNNGIDDNLVSSNVNL